LSQLECSSWTSSVVAHWAILRLKHGGRQFWGGIRKIRTSSPNTEERKSS
jgi:hypothetical protein